MDGKCGIPDSGAHWGGEVRSARKQKSHQPFKDVNTEIRIMISMDLKPIGHRGRKGVHSAQG